MGVRGTGPWTVLISRRTGNDCAMRAPLLKTGFPWAGRLGVSQRLAGCHTQWCLYSKRPQNGIHLTTHYGVIVGIAWRLPANDANLALGCRTDMTHGPGTVVALHCEVTPPRMASISLVADGSPFESKPSAPCRANCTNTRALRGNSVARHEDRKRAW